MATKVPPGFNVRLVLSPTDADGQPAPLDQVDQGIQWASSVADVAVTPEADGLSALVSAPAGFRGTAQIQATGDADLDAGEVRALVGLHDLEYVGGEATVLGINATLEPK